MVGKVVKDPNKSRFPFKIADWWKIESKDSDNPNERFFTREVTPGEAGCMFISL